MTVSELSNTIKQNEDYVSNSLILKSSDNFGCIYKYLLKSNNIAVRKEIFIELSSAESALNLLDKTIINYIEVSPAK